MQPRVSSLADTKLRLYFLGENMRYWLMFLITIGTPIFGVANTLPLAPSVQSELEKRQADRLRELEQEQRSLEGLITLPGKEKPSNKEDNYCFTISTVNFQGNSLFSALELTGLIQAHYPACLGVNGINDLLKIITNHYVAHGYVTSRAVLEQQDLSDQTLSIRIIEGRLEAIMFNGESADFIYQAFPGLVDNVLNLRDIEQGLDQINRLPRYNAAIKLSPGTLPGYSIVNIQTTEARPLFSSVGFNNSGQKNTGEKQLSGMVYGSNLIKKLDLWTLSANTSSDFSTNYASENIRLASSIPYGYLTLQYGYVYSSYKTGFFSNNRRLYSTGDTNAHEASLDWLLYRDSVSKAKIKAGVNYRRDKHYIEGTRLNGSSRNLAHAQIGVSYSRKLGSGFFTFSPAYSRGIKLFNSETDVAKLTGSPSAEFDKAELTVSYSYPFSSTWRYTTTAFGQWTTDMLYGSQRLSIGGEYSVRGFKHQTLSGDEGYYWRNDLAYSARIGALAYSFKLAVDTGAIHPDKSAPYERGHLTGTSLALDTHYKDFRARASIGAPISSPDWLNADDHTFQFSLNYSF